MISIPIDEYSSIIQPYYDGGDSYKGHKKYSLIANYNCCPEGTLKQSWDSIVVTVEANSKTVIECEGMNIDISEFDRFRIYGLIPKCIQIKLFCNNELVIDRFATGKQGFDDGTVKTTQNVINSLRYEFYNQGDCDTNLSVSYLGVISDKKRNKNPYTDEWEGFFSEEPSYTLFNENLIGGEELNKLREKIKYEPYKTAYEETRKIALEAMKVEPESRINKTMCVYHNGQSYLKGTKELAIVGQIEKNYEMLKMACRYALSLACFEYWCEDPMEVAPMTTWHHRSFEESYITRDISIVISLAGGLFSWHGLNFLYNMIIMKGFPRIEADFMTMEYIYSCNQGIVFMSGYLQGLITVAERFPRYRARIEEAKLLLNEMIQKSFEEDGSYREGAMYWDFIVRMYLTCIHFLSRYEKKSMNEYLDDKLDKISNFGISMIDQNAHILTFSDSHEKRAYSMMVSALFYSLTNNEKWAGIFKKSQTREFLDVIIASSVDVPESDKNILNEFSYYPDSGIVQIYRDGVLFAGIAGESNDTHSHCDRGSFIIGKDGRILVPDVCDRYDVAEAMSLYMTYAHSLAVPVIDGEFIEQNRGKNVNAPVEVAEFENGVFKWSVNTTSLWLTDNIKLAKRTVLSDKANEFTFIDEFEFKKPASVEFRVNLRDEGSVEIKPENWDSTKTEVIEIYKNDEAINYQKRIRSDEAKNFKLITKIIV